MISFHSLEQAFWQSISKDHYASDNVKAYISPVTEMQSFNLCYIYEGADINEITHALNWYDAKSRDCMLICPEGQTHLIIQSHQAQWQLDNEDSTTAMVLPLDQWQTMPNLVDGFTINLTNDDLSFWSYPLLTAFSAGYTLHDAIIIHQYQKAHELALQQDLPLYHFALMQNNAPTCNLTLTIIDNGARLDDIGTDVKHQGKGYATALIQHALTFAQEKGAEYCTLEASAEGLSVYQKLGFKPLWNYHAYFRSHSILK